MADEIAHAAHDEAAPDADQNPAAVKTEAGPEPEPQTALAYGDTDTGASEPYTWEGCTKVLTIRIQPASADGTTTVLIAGRTHLDEPVIRSAEISALAPWPAPIAEVLDALAAALPAHAERRLEAIRAEEAARKAAEAARRAEATAAKEKQKAAKEAKTLNTDLKNEVARAKEATKAARELAKAAKAEAAAFKKQQRALERERARLEKQRAKVEASAPAAPAPKPTERPAPRPPAVDPAIQPGLFGAE